MIRLLGVSGPDGFVYRREDVAVARVRFLRDDPIAGLGERGLDVPDGDGHPAIIGKGFKPDPTVDVWYGVD